MNVLDKVFEASQYIRERVNLQVKSAVILGTGLASFVNDLNILHDIPYIDIPHFPQSTVPGHTGKLAFAQLDDEIILIMQGRFHYYEGYDMAELTLPIRVMHALGVDVLCITNIAGGLNDQYKLGDLVVVTDHINLHSSNPLRGLTDDAYGPRFPVMLDAYDPLLIRHAQFIAQENNYRLHEGVYVSLQGPSLETRAEYKFLKLIGADLVGMSTVPEVIVGRQLKMRICVISCVSNVASNPDQIQHPELDEMIAIAQDAAKPLSVIVKGLLQMNL